MRKKIECSRDKTETDTTKIWCDEREGFQYVKSCEVNCTKRYKCKAFKNYMEPGLYESRADN